ncbi:Uncharacterised protein [Klebsiella pneumoniae]|nr:Uncharacterised protein [Klebsiella pneumoniae]
MPSIESVSLYAGNFVVFESIKHLCKSAKFNILY